MNGHVKSTRFGRFMEPAAALLCLLLLMAGPSTRTAAAASRVRQCDGSVTRALKLTRLMQKETSDLIRIYKASQGDMAELFCKVSFGNIPDPGVSGLDPSARTASAYVTLRAFLTHLKRVREQQADLQPLDSPLTDELSVVVYRSRDLDHLLRSLYLSLFPNRSLPEPAGGPTAPPPPLNVFQQKVYGCAVLKTFKEFLVNLYQELRTLKNKECEERTLRNSLA